VIPWKSTMADVLREPHQEFWRPPLVQTTSDPALAEACRRCGTEFMVGAAFCHICGLGRHRATQPKSWTDHFGFLRALDFSVIKTWFGLPVASLIAFLLGIAFVIAGLTMGMISVHDYSDFEAIQFWRIQWLMAACAAFLAGILLKSRKSEG
jgi:ribosomal protein L37E